MISAFVYFGAGLAWTMALGQLVRLRPDGNNRGAITLIVLLLSLGAWQFQSGFFHSKLLLIYPHLSLTGFPFIAITGPLLYLYLRIVLEENFEFRPIHTLHFVPGLILTILLVPFYIQSGPEKLKLIRVYLLDFGSAPHRIFVLPYLLLIFAYLVVMLRHFTFIRKMYYLSQGPYFSIATLIALSFITCIIALAGNALGIYTMFQIASLLVSFITLFIYLMRQRYPELLDNLIVEVQKYGYAKSKLRGVNTDTTLEKLNTLMTVEHLYQDEDLSLKHLAAHLDITPHQLSELLNQHLGKNFNSYVNGFRVAEAMRLLTEEPERTALSVGLAVGFGSNSVFHSAFRKIAGMTPGEFKKKRTGFAERK